MDGKLWLLVLCVLCVTLVAAGQRPSPKPELAAPNLGVREGRTFSDSLIFGCAVAALAGERERLTSDRSNVFANSIHPSSCLT